MKDTGESKDHQLTVALRIRPLSDSEREEAATIVAHRVDNQMVVLMDPMEDPDDILRANRSREKTYMFDVAFDYSANQEEVYRATTKGLIEGLISGYNATVFAYGPTGCGKTYTMLGTDREPGIYVRTLNDLFKAIEETSDDMQYNISMSYLEEYTNMSNDIHPTQPPAAYLCYNKLPYHLTHKAFSSAKVINTEVQAHSTQASRAEMDQLREQLLEAFRSQMEIRRSLMELDNSNMEIQMDTSKHLLTIADWEQERSRRRRKWRAERRKESFSKEESEKDSDCPESPPDSTETQEVAMARENLVTLMAEQKKIRKQKASLESHFVELRERARRLEELLPRRVSCEEQREVLGLLCKVHELEIENAKMQSHALLKDNVIRQKNFVVQRFEQHRHLCDEIIQQQRQFIDDHSLLVPPHLQELYGMYMRELDERNLDRAMALDKVTGCTLKEASLPKISLPSRGRGLLQDVDSDQESVRTMGSETRHDRAKARRHTLPPILPEAEGDNNRVFKSIPHARQMKHSAVMTPPPIHINGQGNRELQPLAPETSLSYCHLSHSVSSHLDSSPESSETGQDVPLTRKERQQILKGIHNIAVKAACRRSKALEVDALRLPPPPSPLDPKKHKSSLSLSEAPPRGLALLRGRQPSPELRHATSDENLSSSTGEGPGSQGTWTRPRIRQPAPKNPNPTLREQDFEARRRKRRSRSFEVTGQALSQSKTMAAQRVRPLDSTSDPHLHINGQPQAPLQRPQHRGVPPLTKVRLPHNNHQTGPITESSPVHLSNLKRASQLRQPQPLLYVTTTGTGGQRTRRH
eukprot:XP_014034406.1 PREDICTED: kinesin-like protein KIF19 [Salmo salar]